MWSEKSRKIQRGLAIGMLVGIPLLLNACNPLNGEGIRLYGGNDKPSNAPAAQQKKPPVNPRPTGSPTHSPSPSPSASPTPAPTTVSLIPNCKPSADGALDAEDKILPEIKKLADSIEAEHPTQNRLFEKIKQFAADQLKVDPTDSKTLDALLAKMQASAAAYPKQATDSKPDEEDVSAVDLRPLIEVFATYQGAVTVASSEFNLSDTAKQKEFADSMLDHAPIKPGVVFAAYYKAFHFAMNQKEMQFKNSGDACELLDSVFKLPNGVHAALRFVDTFRKAVILGHQPAEAFILAGCGSCLYVPKYSSASGCTESTTTQLTQLKSQSPKAQRP